MKQKKLIGCVLAAATFSAPALADTSNVSAYGKINLDYESVDTSIASSATAATSITRMQSNASRLGFKGTEQLDGGLEAIWQIEAQIDPAGNSTTGSIFNGTRNSNVGLKGSFGTISLGNWDTPYKLIHNKVELFDNATVFTATHMIGRTASAKSVNFNTRQSGAVQYWSPKAGGFQGMISYSPDSAQTTTTDKTKLSLSGTFENDMLYGALAYEQRPDQSTAGTTDTATRLVGAFKFGSGLVGATYERLSVGTAAALTETQNNWELSATYKFGSNNIGAMMVNNGNLGATANSGADMYSLRYGYSFSKRTELYAAYTSLQNEANAKYNATLGAVAGAEQSGFGFGMIHSF